MRTTVNLPPAVHRRAQALAVQRGQSLSATVAELAASGLERLEQPVTVFIDELTGFPVMRIGRPVSTADVHAALDDE